MAAMLATGFTRKEVQAGTPTLTDQTSRAGTSPFACRNLPVQATSQMDMRRTTEAVETVAATIAAGGVGSHRLLHRRAHSFQERCSTYPRVE